MTLPWPDDFDAWPVVAAAQAGDEAAFAQLFRVYRPMVHTYFARRFTDNGLVDDLTSETFLRCWRSLDRVRDAGRPFGTWIHTIARNLVIDVLKSSKFQREFAAEGWLLDRPVSDDALDAVLRAEARQHLHDALAELTGPQRRCVQLRFLEELTVRETAAHMSCGVAAVKQLQHRAVRQLTAALVPALGN
jgi:RNA polymerase sigma-70 factor (ECF subfamily)